MTQPVHASNLASVTEVRIAMWLKKDNPDNVRASGKNIINGGCVWCYSKTTPYVFVRLSSSVKTALLLLTLVQGIR